MHALHAGQRLFRLWITSYSGWSPACWSDLPPSAVALEPVGDEAYTARDAAVFLEGFNSEMLAQDGALWVVAVSVQLQFAGDAAPGMLLEQRQLALPEKGEAELVRSVRAEH